MFYVRKQPEVLDTAVIDAATSDAALSALHAAAADELSSRTAAPFAMHLRIFLRVPDTTATAQGETWR